MKGVWVGRLNRVPSCTKDLLAEADGVDVLKGRLQGVRMTWIGRAAAGGPSRVSGF